MEAERSEHLGKGRSVQGPGRRPVGLRGLRYVRMAQERERSPHRAVLCRRQQASAAAGGGREVLFLPSWQLATVAHRTATLLSSPQAAIGLRQPSVKSRPGAGAAPLQADLSRLNPVDDPHFERASSV